MDDDLIKKSLATLTPEQIRSLAHQQIITLAALECGEMTMMTPKKIDQEKVFAAVPNTIAKYRRRQKRK